MALLFNQKHNLVGEDIDSIQMAGTTMAMEGEEILPVFDVEEPEEVEATRDWASYRYFIQLVRRTFPDPGMRTNSSSLASFDVALRSNSHQIKLRIDSFDLTPFGYQTETPTRRWLEFGEEGDGHAIAGSYLTMKDDGYKEWERECMQSVESIGLGQAPLVYAVNFLATSASCSGVEWARSLIIVRLMICEAMKCPDLLNFLAARFLDNVPAPQWIRKLVDAYDPFGFYQNRRIHIGRGDDDEGHSDASMSDGSSWTEEEEEEEEDSDRSLLDEDRHVGTMFATVTVTFVDDKDGRRKKKKSKRTSDACQLYGKIYAYSYDYEGYEFVLFREKAEEHVDVRPGRPITLLRTMVCLPRKSRLLVRAELFEYEADSSFDREVAKDVLVFPVHSLDSEETMFRESGKIQIKVVRR